MFEYENDHEEGNKNCPSCWFGYPVACECGGLIHAAFGDENEEGDWWLIYKCDKCGEDYEEATERILNPNPTTLSV